MFYVLTECVSTQPLLTGDPSGRTPSAEREFRAAWVATVANINWPSRPGLSPDQQKKEALALLDVLHDHHFNAVILQVRPQCDALYQSSLEPWSYFLTGVQGEAPEPMYDPLLFWIEEAHKRGIELHAWLNPYRAHHTTGGEVTGYSIVKTKPELVVQLENGLWWLDPGLKGTQDHSFNVVMDIVKRYDVDGIHFDDYFYPYPSYNNNKDFPDNKSWNQYKINGGKLSRGDWRRENVNTFIKRLYGAIKDEKPHVKFGLSPFGIWRPNNPLAIEGFDQYNQLYADAKLWLNEGWIDYMTPFEDLVVDIGGISLERANKRLKESKKGMVLLIDNEKNRKLISIVCRKDLEKNYLYPNACKDKNKRLRVAGAVGPSDVKVRAKALIDANVDALVIDTAHAHSKNVLDTIKYLKMQF